MDWDSVSRTVKWVFAILIFVFILLLFHVELRPLVKVLVDAIVKVIS